jgi:hypothetical protein
VAIASACDGSGLGAPRVTPWGIFGLPELLAACVLACLPLAVCLGTRVPRGFGAGVLMLALFAVPVLDPGSAEVGWLARTGLRFALSLAIGLGLACMFGVRVRSLGWSVLVPALLFACVPVLLYQQMLMRRLPGEILTARELGRMKEAERRALAWQALQGPDAGNPLPVLQQQIAEWEREVRLPLSFPGRPQRMQRSRTLARLERYDEALQTLMGLSDADAERLRGALLQAAGRYAESDAAYIRCLARYPRATILAPLAFNARQRGDFREAIARERERLMEAGTDEQRCTVLKAIARTARQAGLSSELRTTLDELQRLKPDDAELSEMHRELRRFSPRCWE